MAWPFDISPLFLPRSIPTRSGGATVRTVGGPSVRASDIIETRRLTAVLPALDRARAAALPTLDDWYVRRGGRPEHAARAASAYANGIGSLAMPYAARVPGMYPLHDAMIEGQGFGIPGPLETAARALPGAVVSWQPTIVVPDSYEAGHAGEVDHLTCLLWQRMVQNAASSGSEPRGPVVPWSARPIVGVTEISTPPAWLPSPSTADLVRSFACFANRDVHPSGYPYMPTIILCVMGPTIIVRFAVQRPPSPMDSIPLLTTVFVVCAAVVITMITAGVGTAVTGLVAAGAISAALAGGALVLAAYLEREAREWLDRIGEAEGLSEGDREIVRTWTRSFLARITSDAEAGRMLPPQRGT